MKSHEVIDKLEELYSEITSPDNVAYQYHKEYAESLDKAIDMLIRAHAANALAKEKERKND